MGMQAHRWLMTQVAAPMVREGFDALAGTGEVVIAVAGCGVCHTDLGYYYDGVRTNQPLPLALGHEVSGKVVAAGSGSEHWIGKSAIVPAVLPCGQCDLCQRGLTTICRSQKMPGNDIQGGFASHIVVPGRGLCEVDDARLAQAGLTLGQVSIVADALTTPYQAVRRSGVGPGSLAIVVGATALGFADQLDDAPTDRRRQQHGGRVVVDPGHGSPPSASLPVLRFSFIQAHGCRACH